MSRRLPYLFIDRDGTLINEPLPSRQIDSLAKLKLERNVVPALLELKKAGFRLVMVSNQDGVGTESFPREDFWVPHNALMDLLDSQGVRFEASLVCPHFAGDECTCRKPKLGLVADYLQAGVIDFERSYVIGDRDSDTQLARSMGIKGLLYSRDDLNWMQIVEQLTRVTRTASIERYTNETQIVLSIDLNGKKRSTDTGNAFFDHMIDQIAVHAGFGISLSMHGDWQVDDHHCVEDVALTLGEAIDQALGERRGIGRYGFTLPMDETLASCTVDLSGRPVSVFTLENKCWPRESVGGIACEMVPHFFKSISVSLRCAVHLSVRGDNAHHLMEACFKVFGRALRQAIQRDRTNELPSSKGVL